MGTEQPLLGSANVLFDLCTCTVRFCWIVLSVPSSAPLGCEIALSSGTSCRSGMGVRIATPDSVYEMSAFSYCAQGDFPCV